MKREYLAMYFHEEDIRNESLEKGKEIGRFEGEMCAKKESLFKLLDKLGDLSDTVINKIEVEEDIAVLDNWFEFAIEASSIKEFLEKM